VHDDNSVVALGSDGLDEGVTFVPESKVVAVALVSIEGDVSLASSGICEDDASTADLRDTVSKGSLLGVGVVVDDALDRATVAEDLGLDGLEGSYEVREVSCKLISKCKPCRVPSGQ
jgi:hypothetical protein